MSFLSNAFGFLFKTTSKVLALTQGGLTPLHVILIVAVSVLSVYVLTVLRQMNRTQVATIEALEKLTDKISIIDSKLKERVNATEINIAVHKEAIEELEKFKDATIKSLISNNIDKD